MRLCYTFAVRQRQRRFFLKISISEGTGRRYDKGFSWFGSCPETPPGTWAEKRIMITGMDFIQQKIKLRRKAVLIDGFEVPGITARYALQNRLSYRIESGGYEHAGIR